MDQPTLRETLSSAGGWCSVFLVVGLLASPWILDGLYWLLYGLFAVMKLIG